MTRSTAWMSVLVGRRFLFRHNLPTKRTMSDQKREKLSDVHNRSEYVLAPKTTFEKAYPTIAKLLVKVSEGAGGFGESRTITLTEQDFSHAVNCSNPVCYGGGVEVGWFIHDMVRAGKTEDSTSKSCQGYEGSPKGKKRYRSCMNFFRVHA